jgi:hypothetical protein
MYATLSYCWGSQASDHKLVEDNVAEYMERLPMERLPQTIKDTISVTRVLPVDYLWIDALCIKQDSGQDKDTEVANMHNIYEKSFVTIVAASAEGVHEGFLQRRTPRQKPGPRYTAHVCYIPYGTSTYVPFRISETQFGTITLKCSECLRSYKQEDEPIHQRAWTIQQITLAQRILFYSSETLHWQCRSERKTLGNGHQPIVEPLSPKDLSFEITSIGEALKTWGTILEAYCSRGLSIQTDRLPAIAAIARQFQAILGPVYHAGLWQGLWPQILVPQLMWETSRPLITNPRRCMESPYVAPTWSWASVKTSFDVKQYLGTTLETKILSEVTDVFTRLKPTSHEEANISPYGEVIGGHITIRGMVMNGYYIAADVRPIWKSDFDPKEDYSKHWLGGTIIRGADISRSDNGENDHDLGILPTHSVTLARCYFDYQDDLDTSQRSYFRFRDELIPAMPIKCLMLIRDGGLLLEKVTVSKLGVDKYRRLGVCRFRTGWTSVDETQEVTIV